MTTPIKTKPGPKDYLEGLSVRAYEEAYTRGLSFSAHLEDLFPQRDFKDGLDAYSRLLMLANIQTRSIPEFGMYADPLEVFGETPQTRALFPEWVARQWRSVSTGRTMLPQGGITHAQARANTAPSGYTSQDYAVNSWANPYVDAGVVRNQTILPAIPLSTLVAITTPIDGTAYRAFYLQDADVSASQLRWVRVGESTPLPRAKIVGGQRMVNLYKYGRAIEVTYEMLRRSRLDVVALHIQRMAAQAEKDKVATALDVMINGDGNASTSATNYNLTSLDSSATPGTLTLKGWLAFKMKFLSPYSIGVALVQEAVALQMMLLNTGTANLPLSVMPAPMSNVVSFQPINPGLADGVRLGWTSDAPSLKIVGFDPRFALERVTEVGSNISETARWIDNQTELLTLSEVEGYAVFDTQASKTLNINA